MKFCTVVCSRLNVRNWVQKFLGPSLKKFRGQKLAKFGVISDNFKDWRYSTANISGRDEDIQSRSSIWSTAIPFAFGKKKSGELWPTNYGDLEMESYPPKSIFWGETIFWSLRCAAPKISTRSREWPRLIIAHFTWDKGLPYNFFSKGIKNWLKM